MAGKRGKRQRDRVKAILFLQSAKAQASDLADAMDPKRKFRGDHIVYALDAILAASAHALNVEKGILRARSAP